MKRSTSPAPSLILGSLVGAGLIAAASAAASQTIRTPEDARAQGLESLRLAVQRDGSVPLPANLDAYVKDREAAVQLGKALFWDMQVGSDGIMACATCHFHAGADSRTNNQFNPDRLTVVDSRNGDIRGYGQARIIADLHFETRLPNQTLTREDFPLIRTIERFVRSANGTILPAEGNSNDIMSSMGTFFTFFEGVRPGSPFDAGTLLSDPTWHVEGRNVRRVEPRNSPTVINAVFNYTNFWDGRANPHFNGVDSFGEQDPFATVAVNRPGVGLLQEAIAIDNASLASQALTPPTSFVELSFGSPGQGNFRSIPEIGVKLLRPSPQTGSTLIPLGQQRVDPRDSVLGSLSNAPRPGLSVSYEALIKKAFADQYWNSTELIFSASPSTDTFTQMEFNFGLFFGLAVALYEATLVADQSPFDQWMQTGRFNDGFGPPALAGLNLFVNEGRCVSCHTGPELTKASVRHAQGGRNVISAMTLASGTALYDTGFYNIGVTPTTDDLGRGSRGPLGFPGSFSRQALFDRLGLATIQFPILGNETLPARDEDLGLPVCEDANGNAVCERTEAILPQFQRAAVDGAFKTPGLRNVELTGPYFHNGGMATLRQVVQFYNRGGNFCNFNRHDLDRDILPLGLSAAQERQLVAFLVSLTDERVKYRSAPFDHPELRVPSHGFDTTGMLHLKAVGTAGAGQALKPFLDLDPQDAIFTPAGICSSEPNGTR